MLRYHEEEQEKERIGEAEQEGLELDDLVQKRSCILITMRAKRNRLDSFKLGARSE